MAAQAAERLRGKGAYSSYPDRGGCAGSRGPARKNRIWGSCLVFCWRIAKKRYAATAFDGEGSRRKGGRWTPKGFPAVYTAQTESLAALEQFVQLGDEGQNIQFVCFKVKIPDSVGIEEIDISSLPKNWK